VKAVEQTQPAYGTQKTEKADAVYTLIRVASVWYLYDEHSDGTLTDLREKE
jgi:hypothetical protein